MYGFTFGRPAGPAPSPGGEAAAGPPGRKFRVRCGRVYGEEHLFDRMNNQDSFALTTLLVNGKHYVFGVVCDGCTGGPEGKKRSRTEVGSALLSQYALSEIRTLLSLGVPIREIPKTLYARCVSYIGNVARTTVAGTPAEMSVFIRDHFLSTLLGFVMELDGDLVAFDSGDGFFIVNDHDVIVDAQDAALYMAYHQIDRSFLPKGLVLPEGFTVRVYDSKFLQQFAVGSDGLIKRREGTLQPYIDPEERKAIFANRRKAPAGLQWWLNGQQTDHQRFTDDTTIITIEAIEEESQGESAASDSAKGGTGKAGAS